LLSHHAIALVAFSPSKLPQIGNSLGKAIRDFKKSLAAEEIKEISKELKKEVSKPLSR
jgi:TatA/E family protein of Tat protein translocase